MVQATVPTSSISPSAAFNEILPLSSATSINVALSDSSSAISVFFRTTSPSFTSQRESSTWVMDSPGLGIFISMVAILNQCANVLMCQYANVPMCQCANVLMDEVNWPLTL